MPGRRTTCCTSKYRIRVRARLLSAAQKSLREQLFENAIDSLQERQMFSSINTVLAHAPLADLEMLNARQPGLLQQLERLKAKFPRPCPAQECQRCAWCRDPDDGRAQLTALNRAVGNQRGHLNARTALRPRPLIIVLNHK